MALALKIGKCNLIGNYRENNEDSVDAKILPEMTICMVADGTYEGYWERKLRPWDIAGGIAIVRGAGGRVSEFEGGTECMTSGHVVATNGHIHDALLGELARVKPLSIPPATS